MVSRKIIIDGNLEDFQRTSTAEGSPRLFTAVKILLAESLTIEHLTQLRDIFPSLTELTIEGGACRKESKFNLQNVLKGLWSLPLEKLKLKYLPVQKSVTNWASFDPPTFQNTLRHLVVIGSRMPEDFTEFLVSSNRWKSLELLKADSTVLDSMSLERLPGSCPLITDLTCNVSNRYVYNLQFPNLKRISLRLTKVAAKKTLDLGGSLPQLTHFTLVAPTKKGILINPTVLLSSKELESVTIDSPEAFRVIENFIHPWTDSGISPHLTISSSPTPSGSSNPEERSTDNKDWEILNQLISGGFKVSPDSVVKIMDSVAKFEQVRPYLQTVLNVAHLKLQGPVHSYLLTQLPVLSSFVSLHTLDIFDANEVTSQGFSELLKSASSLADLTMWNNDSLEFTTLSGESTTIKRLNLIHFHALLNFELKLPALETLTLDNCDGESVPDQSHHNVVGRDGPRCYGNFQERVLKELLSGSEDIQLGSLQKLTLFHNSNATGEFPPVYEELRVDIDSSAGHPTLKELYVYNCAHVKTLKLNNMPNMESLQIDSQADGEEEHFWMEKLELDLPLNCKINVKNVLATHTKVGI